ncbi:MAG: hypothetical protein ACLTX3_08605 [Lachnospiraceae bacterium]
MKITPKEINVFKEDFIATVKGLEKKYGVEIALKHPLHTRKKKFEGKMTVTNLKPRRLPKKPSGKNLNISVCTGNTGHVQTDLPWRPTEIFTGW